MSEIKVIGAMDNTVDHTFESANRVYGTDGISPTINTYGGGGLQAKVMEVQRVIFDDFHSKVKSDQSTMLTLTTECGNAALRHNAKIIEISKGNVAPQFEKFIYEIDGELYLIRIRKLTPRECWRLMGFTDDDYDKAAKVNSHTQLYKQAGNSIVKNVLMAVFKQMLPPVSRMEYLRRKALAALNM